MEGPCLLQTQTCLAKGLSLNSSINLIHICKYKYQIYFFKFQLLNFIAYKDNYNLINLMMMNY